MSFVGDLEHMPIVDVMQLLHSTRKSGILSVKSRKGESRLVFKDGYIVSANHLDNTLRIGNILVEKGLITPENLECALQEQAGAGTDRKPLIITLVNNGLVGEEDAYQALEYLIEMTVVEILTWKRGTFSLDVAQATVPDGYRYYPERMSHEINVDTQGVLMDALRIYDEKMRDGLLVEEEGPLEEGIDSGQVVATITADDLGLGNLDALEKKIPDVFLGVKAYDPTEPHRQAIAKELEGMPLADQEKLFAYLVALTQPGAEHAEPTQTTGRAPAVILFSRDPFVTHAVTAVCKHGGIFLFTTDDEANIDPIVDQTLSRELFPILLVDTPEMAAEGFSTDGIVALWHRKKRAFPQLSILQFTTPGNYSLSAQAMEAGISGTLPRPSRQERNEMFATDAIGFMKASNVWLATAGSGADLHLQRLFADRSRELGEVSTAPEISLAILKFAAAMFERCITFVVAGSELIAERGIGVREEKSAGPTPPLLFKVPLDTPSVFRDAVEQGRLFYGHCSDPLLQTHLYAEIGTPSVARILIAPIKSLDRIVALTYCDFGARGGAPVRPDLVETLSRLAGLALDSAQYRKKFENRV